MANRKRVIILGGHGKVARLAGPKFVAAGWSVTGIIRNPEHRADLEAAGALPVLLDIERAEVDHLAAAFTDAAAVVFAAGAGGGNPVRTNAVDYEAAVCAMQAAEHAAVRRFVTVSYATASVDMERVDPTSSFYPYVLAKSAADAHLRGTDLDYTILGPGSLTLEPGTGRIQLADHAGDVAGHPPADTSTSRDNVAEVLVHVITRGAAIRQTVNFYDGPAPIADAIPTA